MPRIGKKVIFLMGLTASGKTNLAIKISNHFNTRLISVDSALIYKGMDIGTAKPDSSILKKYPHYLIDTHKPEQQHSVNNFIIDAKAQIKQAFKNNEVPLLVGGSSFYFNALEHGLSKLPESTLKSRSKFNAMLKKQGCQKMHAMLVKIDKKSAKKIHHNDSQRITRALEVFYLSGKTLSELQGNKKPIIDCEIKKIILIPDRSELRLRIKKRFLLMIKNGFLDEVRKLKQNTNLNKYTTSIRCIGYKQAWQYLEGEIDKQTMIDNAITTTCQLCKRQHTWLKNEKNALIIKKINMLKIIEYII